MNKKRFSWPNALKEIDVLFCQIILFIFIGITSLQVISRYVFSSPMSWPEELNAILLIWMTFIGAVALTRRKDHIRVEMVEELAGKKIALALDVIFDAATIAFLGWIIFGGWELVQQLSFERTPALRLRLSVIIAIVPITALAMTVFYVISLVDNARLLWRGGRDGD